MDGQVIFSLRHVSAYLLILGFVVFTVGGILYSGRAIWKWPVGETPRYLLWERGFVVSALLMNVLGLVLLERILHDAGDSYVARLGAVTYLVGAIVGIVGETSYLSKREWVYPQIVLYVVLAFLAQIAFGVALLQTGLTAGWIGWATILWNLIWPVVLSIATPREIYFPVLHHIAPLLIGIALLIKP